MDNIGELSVSKGVFVLKETANVILTDPIINEASTTKPFDKLSNIRIQRWTTNDGKFPFYVVDAQLQEETLPSLTGEMIAKEAEELERQRDEFNKLDAQSQKNYRDAWGSRFSNSPLTQPLSFGAYLRQELLAEAFMKAVRKNSTVPSLVDHSVVGNSKTE